ncbi:MAG: PAS domain S-box protein [Vicinamibacterales bacterium]|nr:PAS domain S-box protein [Vicinamibacterales bacterium]
MTPSIRLRIALGLTLIVLMGASSIYVLYAAISEAAALAAASMPAASDPGVHGDHDMWLAHARLNSLLAHARTQLVVLLPGFLLLSGVAAVSLLRAVRAPFRTLAAGIGAMAAGDWQHRLPESGPREFAEVARQFNRLAEERLAVESERDRLNQACEQAAEIVMVTEPDGTIVYVNPAFERVSGYTRDEALGRTPKLVSSGRNSPDLYRDLWQTIRAGGVWQGELVNLRKDGTLYIERHTISPVRGGDGAIQFFVSIGADITAQRRLESQLNQAAKMEAIGRLAGGVAHDFNNLLMVISGGCEKLATHWSRTSGDRESLEVIAKAAEKAASLTRRLLAFSRQQATEPRSVNLNEVIGGMEAILARLIGEDVHILTVFEEPLPPVNVDPAQVEQVVLNLAVNARDAMPEGGHLVLRTETVQFDEAGHAEPVDFQPGRYVLFSVSDTGSGMDAHTLAHVFEPFFTTKDLGEGTGLGLSTVYGLVSQYEGHIQVRSEVGQGTTFDLYLPVCEACVDAVSRVPDPPPVRATGGTILLVEDDDDVRMLLAAALGEYGYDVMSATDGVDGLARAGAYRGRIDLLVTDMVMPRMGGLELARELTAQRPGLAVLYLTGYAPEGVSGDSLVPGARFLHKPVALSVLAGAVGSLLAERPATEQSRAG